MFYSKNIHPVDIPNLLEFAPNFSRWSVSDCSGDQEEKFVEGVRDRAEGLETLLEGAKKDLNWIEVWGVGLFKCGNLTIVVEMYEYIWW